MVEFIDYVRLYVVQLQLKATALGKAALWTKP